MTTQNAITLVASVNDDGLPNPPGVVSLQWSLASGPSGGVATFGTPTALSTTVSFSLAGVYTIRLSAFDGDLTGFDDHLVNVSAPAQNTAPTVGISGPSSVTLPNSISLTGAVSDDGLPNPPGAVTLSWSVVSGPGPVSFGNPTGLSTGVTFQTAGTYVLRLEAFDGTLTGFADFTVIVAPVPNTAPVVNVSGAATITLPNTISLTGAVSDDGLPNPPGTVTLQWGVISGPAAVIFSNPTALTTQVTFSLAGSYVLRLTANDGALTGFDNHSVTVSNPLPTNQAPQVSIAGSTSVVLPGSITLNGSVTDDGLPNPPGIVTLQWLLISAPSGGIATFSNPNGLSTNISFNLQGSYVLRLEAFDGALTGAATHSVTVSAPAPVNTAPTVGISGPASVTLPSLIQLVATVNDDGLPNPPGFTTVQWSLVSGPGTVAFTPDNDPISIVSFSQGGTYIIRCTASDGALSGFDDHTVIATVPAANTAPTVAISGATTVSLPGSITLTGSVSDDGLPNPPGMVALSWSVQSAPSGGNASFGNPTGLVTSVDFDLPGVYVLRLQGFDGDLTGAATHAVTASAPVIDPATGLTVVPLTYDFINRTWTGRLSWVPGRLNGTLPTAQYIDLQPANAADWSTALRVGPLNGMAVFYQWPGLADDTSHRWRVVNIFSGDPAEYYSVEQSFDTTGWSPSGTGLLGLLLPPLPPGFPTPDQILTQLGDFSTILGGPLRDLLELLLGLFPQQPQP